MTHHQERARDFFTFLADHRSSVRASVRKLADAPSGLISPETFHTPALPFAIDSLARKPKKIVGEGEERTMITKVTVYSKPNCSNCESTYRILGIAHVEFDKIDITTNPASLSYITEDLGYSAAPVVVVDFDNGETDHWSGLRVDKIQQLNK
jgi:glutaredoxin-like protein NrdH